MTGALIPAGLEAYLQAQGWTDAADIVAEVTRFQAKASPVLAEWTLPWPPTTNTYFRSIVMGGASRVIISKNGRAYADTVAKLMLGKPKVAHGIPLAVHVLCYPPDRRTRDLGNLDKALMDSIVKAGMFRDDFDIWDLRLVRAVASSPPGRVVVQVRQHIMASEAPRLPTAMEAFEDLVLGDGATKPRALPIPPKPF